MDAANIPFDAGLVIEDKLAPIMNDYTIIDVTDGVVTRLHFDGDDPITQHTQDVEPVLDRNKALYTHNDGYSASREMRRVASIPAGVQLQWIAKYGVDPCARGNEALLKRLLNDPEFLYLRTAPGRL